MTKNVKGMQILTVRNWGEENPTNFFINNYEKIEREDREKEASMPPD